MANYDVTVALHHPSNLPENDVVNTLHFEQNLPDTKEGASDDIANAYKAAMTAGLLGNVTGITVKWYEPGLNPGGPAFTKKYTTGFTSAAQSGPLETAICLSYATVDNVEASTPRRRGRIYIGPIAGGVQNISTVGAGLRNIVLTLGQNLASVGNAGNTTWMLYSRADNAYVKIESIWCDDAWDTQRRRGLAPSLRQAQDVQ